MQIFRGKISELISQMNAKFAAPIGTSFLRSNTNMRPGLTIMAHIQYAESADMEEVLAKGSRLIEYCQLEEQATQSYFWALEAGNPRSILIFEQFKSRDFCFGTHMKTGEFRAATGTQTEGLVAKPTFVSIKFGFQRAMAMNNG
jgi:quinol monooxygenase YgiN